ncbi:cereblon family protein [Desulforegula conservatrix]|uniref:cereblon family protein n=1 Tax=Desulforegula conservatrix TaxID=153026 RepID=UPI000427931F|nr:cereblon family protein [Desulforegula conservatrix]
MKAELNHKANIFCLKSDPDDLPSETVSSFDEAYAKHEDENFILCRNCGSPLTSINFKISVNGNHTHAFVNPYGMVFEIACFSKAPGCSAASRPSDEFSWFKGHTWMVSVCKLCLNHNGWLFESKDHFFFGLILDQIICP